MPRSVAPHVRAPKGTIPPPSNTGAPIEPLRILWGPTCPAEESPVSAVTDKLDGQPANAGER